MQYKLQQQLDGEIFHDFLDKEGWLIPDKAFLRERLRENFLMIETDKMDP